MQTIKKFVLLTCATWGMQGASAHADQATNAIYAEKGKLMIHLGNVPAKYQKIQVPIWSDQNGQDDLIWYPVERSDTGFNLEVPLINHSDQAGLYHVHVYGVEGNGQVAGLYPLTTSVQEKDLASSQPKITIKPVSSQEFEVDLRLFEDVEEIVFPYGQKRTGRTIWSGTPQRRSHQDISNCAFRPKNTREVAYFTFTSTRKRRGNCKECSQLPSKWKRQGQSSLHSRRIQETPTPSVNVPGVLKN